MQSSHGDGGEAGDGHGDLIMHRLPPITSISLPPMTNISAEVTPSSPSQASEASNWSMSNAPPVILKSVNIPEDVSLQKSKFELSHASTRCNSWAVWILCYILCLMHLDHERKWMYHARAIFLFTILCFKPINYLMMCFDSVINSDELSMSTEKLLTVTMLEVLVPIQYVCSLHYFRSDHFVFMTTTPPPTIIVDRSCVCDYKKLILALAMMAMVSSVVTETTTTMTSPHSYIVLPFLAMSTLLGRLVIGLNSMIFICTFWKHSKDMHAYMDFLRRPERQHIPTGDRVKHISMNLIYLRYSIANSCQSLYFIFTSSTVVAGITFAFWAHLCYQESELIEEDFVWGSLGMFIIIELFFVRVTMNIRHCKDQVERIIFSPRFAISNIIENNTSTALMNTVNFLVIQSLLNSEWVRIMFAGMSIHDGKVVRPLVAAGAFFLLAVNYFTL